jgi:UDP-glucose 4-epimerase
MKVVVFGGGGFLGSAIVDRLLLDGHQLRIFERPRVAPYRSFTPNESVEWVAGDFSSTHDLGEAVRSMDAVVHLVSTTLPKNSNDDPVYDVQSNVVSTLHMLNAMVAAKVPKIVFISSGGTVYGNPVYLPVDELHPTDPVVSYGITKLTVEKYLHMYTRMHGLQAVSLRVANPYGERQRVETAQGAVGVFLHHALKGMPISIWGDGSITRDYLHVSDVAEAFARALHYKGNQRVFNVSSGVGTSLNDLLSLLETLLDKPIVRNYLPGRPFDVPASVLSNKLACTELQWLPAISMEAGLARTAAWMKQDIFS